MDKKILCLIIILLALPAVNAALNVKNIEVYVDDKIETGADEDGGTIDVARASKLEFDVKVDNQISNDTTYRLNVVLKGIKSNGDDLSETSEWWELTPYSEQTKSFRINIPSDAKLGNFDVDFKLRWYSANNESNEYTKDYDFDIDIVDKKDESAELNLTKTLIETCKTLAQNTNGTLIKQVIDCETEKQKAIDVKDFFKENLYRCETEWNSSKIIMNDTRNALSDAQGNSTRWESKWDSCNNDLSSKASQINDCEKEKKDAEGKSLMWGIGGLILGIIGAVMVNKGKHPMTPEQEQFG